MARAAAVWRDCGVEPGESVAVALANHAEAIVACLGVARAGGVRGRGGPGVAPRSEIEQLWLAGRWRFILAESREEQGSRDQGLRPDARRMAAGARGSRPIPHGIARYHCAMTGTPAARQWREAGEAHIDVRGLAPPASPGRDPAAVARAAR